MTDDEKLAAYNDFMVNQYQELKLLQRQMNNAIEFHLESISRLNESLADESNF